MTHYCSRSHDGPNNAIFSFLADVYFLNNMKAIDDVTSTYLVDLTAVLKWGSSSINVMVKTWPFVSLTNVRNDSTRNAKCGACSDANAKQTAIFYGQPYQRETLQGCNSDSIPNNLDKVFSFTRYLTLLPCRISTKRFTIRFHFSDYRFMQWLCERNKAV